MMISDPDALADIINEIGAALEPRRPPDGQLPRHAMERARAEQAKVVPRLMARLALRSSVDDVAEILADLAVELDLAKAEAKAELRCVYEARLEGRRAAASAHSRGPLAPQI